MRPSFPIARKLLLAVGGGSVLIYITIAVLEARLGRLMTLEVLERFSEDFVGSRAAQLDAHLGSTEAVAHALATTAPLSAGDAGAMERALCGALVAPLQGIRLVMERSAPSGPGRRGWSCVLEGQARRFAAFAVPEDGRGRDVPRAEGSWSWAPAASNAPAGTPTYSLGVFDGEGEATRLRATLQVDLSLAHLGQVVESLRPARGAAFLVAGAGEALLPPLTTPGESAEIGPILARLRAEGGDRGLYVGRFPGLDGPSRIGYRKVPTSGWWLVAAAPESVLLGELDALRRQLLLLMSMGALVLLTVTAVLARSITRPVTRLASAARLIAGGDLESAAPATALRDEVGDLARSFEEMRVSLRHHIAEVERHAAARARTERDLKIAREIQVGLLPTDFAEVTGGFAADLFALVAPAREVGGDLYDVFRIDDRHACLVLGDVSGKGIPAALFMTAARTLFRALAQEKRQPAEILALVNHALAAENPRSMFVTAFCGVLDLTNGHLTFANAGHLPPAIVPRSGPARFGPEVPGTPLGLMPGTEYLDTELALAPGDTILLYTDGVTEAFDADQKLFEPERLLARLEAGARGGARQTVEDVLEGVRAFAGEAPQSDDIGLLALRWDGPAGSS